MTNIELLEYAYRLNLPFFRGVLMTDELRKHKPWSKETLILNLDRSTGEGTHWVAIRKNGSEVIYFDSFGLRPPPEVIKCYRGSKILYNNEIKQKFDSSDCGKLCLEFLIGW